MGRSGSAGTRSGDGELAPRLKALREERGLSLRALSRETGVAVSFLSGLESGRANVSVATLRTLLDALGSSLGEFFSRVPPPPAKVAYRRRELVEISGQKRGVSFREVAAGRAGRMFQLLVERYAAGADTGPGMYRHGRQEAGVVLRGTLELRIDGEVHVLGPGDAWFFDSRRPHRFRNRGRTPVEAVSVNAPPSL
jgi:transcriptional regulator with XRE-family HTH domain